MRIARDVIVSLGAGGSLVAAGACSLLVVSAVVAFEGWPDVATPGDEPVPALVVAAPGATDAGAAQAGAPRLVIGGTAGLAPASERQRGGGDAATRPDEGAGATPGAPTAPATPAPAGGGSSPAISTPSDSGAPGSAAAPISVPAAAGAPALPPVTPPASPSNPAAPVTDAAAGAVQQTGAAAGQAVQQAAPPVAPVGDAVTDLAGTVGNAVGDLGHLPGGH